MDSEIAGPVKGLAPTTAGRSLHEIASARPSLFGGDFTAPVMTLRRSALDHNIATMARYCRNHGVDLAPHGKTTMAPELWRRQLAAGAWGITVATPGQIAVCRSVGVPRVLLANELVDGPAIEWLLSEIEADPTFHFLCYVDSVAGVERLGRAIAAAPDVPDSARTRPLDLLLEMGFSGGRTGCRTAAQAVDVARAAAATPGLRIVGVAGFEGGIGSELTPQVFAAVDSFLLSVHETASELIAADLVTDRGGGVILSAGGSVFFDRAVEILKRPLRGGEKPHCVIRSGCYVSHDSGFYERMSPFSRPGSDPDYTLIPAIEIWGEVLSIPEPGLAIIGIGRRDVPFDLGLPLPLLLRSNDSGPAGSFGDVSACSVEALNDQHAFVRMAPDKTVRLGDWMSFGISHPCTAFDKWRSIAEIDDEFRVLDFVETSF
jgi:D-serine deaminase-like pyridoxal phosphate-dependent protein